MADVAIRAVLEAQDNMSAALSKAGGGLASLRTKLTLAAGAASAWALAAGKAADDARQTIVQGTGATGEALDSLVGSYNNLAGAIAGVDLSTTSTAIADLNTHLGLTGPELEQVATAALKAGVNTNQFGSIAAKMGLDVEGSTTLLDQLTQVSQNTGVGVNEMLRSVQRVGPRFEAAGVSTGDLVSIVAQLAEEAGPGGARSALSELAEEVDKGNIPAFKSLAEQVGNVTGKVEETHAAGVGYLEQLGALKDRAMALVGEHGNLIGTFGSIGTSLIGLGPMLPALAGGFRTMWLAITGPVGLVTAAVLAVGAAFYTFRQQIGDVLSGVIRFVGGWVSKYIGLWEKAFSWMPGIGPKLANVADTIQGFVDDATDSVSGWVDGWGEVEPAVEEAAGAVGGAEDAVDELTPTLVTSTTAAEGLAEAADEARQAFLDWAASTHALNVALSSQALKSTSIVEGFRAAGNNAGLEFDLAFMQGPGGVMTKIPQNMMTVANDGSWMIAGGQGGEAMAASTTSAFDKFGGWGRMFDGVMGAFHGFLDGGWKGGLSQLANMALSFLPPGLAQAAQAALGAFKAVWNKFFKKPSEAELQARASFEGMQDAFKENIGEIPRYQEYVNSLLSQGWDRNLAEVKAGFDYWAQQAGLGFEESGRLYTQYQDAIKAGDNEEVARIEGIIQSWRERGQAAADATNEAAEAAAAAAEAHRQFMDGVFQNVIGAWDRAKQAGVSAYDETYAAAIEAGAGEEEAVAKATAARIDAKNRILQEEGDKYARLAAFEAALEAIRNGNAAGAAEAARQAAQQTRDAWDTALGAVAVADGIANDAVADGAKTTADDVIEEAERTQKETVQAAQEAADQQAIAAEEAELARIEAANDAADAEKAAAERSVTAINEAFDRLEAQTVTVDYVVGEIPDAPRPEGRALGGPVSAGVPYIVGEHGPELFVPRRDGGVIPNGRGMGGAGNVYITINTDGTADGRKVARQVARGLSDLQLSR